MPIVISSLALRPLVRQIAVDSSRCKAWRRARQSIMQSTSTPKNALNNRLVIVMRFVFALTLLVLAVFSSAVSAQDIDSHTSSRAVRSGVFSVDAIAPDPPLLVFDAANKLVGRVVSVFTTPYDGAVPIVAHRVNGIVFALSVLRTKQTGTSLIFSTQNCSGEAYISDSDLPFQPAVVVDSTLYLPDANADVQTITMRARSSDGHTCDYVVERTATVRPVVAVPNYFDQFTPPYRVK